MSDEYRPNSLRARVRRFFRENPGEFLTYADMQQKFDCTYQQAATVVHALTSEGLLETVNLIRRAEAGRAS